MVEAAGALVAAFWLGVLTSISPCPLATNIAAVSYIGREIGHPRKAALAGLVYTAGRMLTYAAIAGLLVAGLHSAPQLSHLLQKYMNKALGPLLIVTGMVLLELIRFGSFGAPLSEERSRRTAARGLLGAGALGVVFALSFCPVSAALYFGSLIPIAIERQSPVSAPLVYGLGTGLPVALFGLVTAAGAASLGRWFQRVQTFERWARPATGVIFILVGVYLTLVYVFGVSWLTPG